MVSGAAAESGAFAPAESAVPASTAPCADVGAVAAGSAWVAELSEAGGELQPAIAIPAATATPKAAARHGGVPTGPRADGTGADDTAVGSWRAGTAPSRDLRPRCTRSCTLCCPDASTPPIGCTVPITIAQHAGGGDRGHPASRSAAHDARSLMPLRGGGSYRVVSSWCPRPRRRPRRTGPGRPHARRSSRPMCPLVGWIRGPGDPEDPGSSAPVYLTG